VKIIRTGATRWVLLIGRYAVKFPSLYSYRHFLQGILGNEQETFWYKSFKWTGKLCPVLFCFPGCFFIVMPRVRVMTDDEAKEIWGLPPCNFDGSPTPCDEFLRIEPGEESIFPAEKKSDSFGWLDGKLVIIDYGS
jgi:hypothetical protein